MIERFGYLMIFVMFVIIRHVRVMSASVEGVH